MSRPEGDGRRRTTVRPTARAIVFFAAALGSAAAAYFFGRSELLYAAGFLAILPLFSLLLVGVRPLRFTVIRRFSPAVVTAGSPTVVELEIRNDSTFTSSPATWYDRIPWNPGRAGPGTLTALPAGGTAGGGPAASGTRRLGYALRPGLRGVYSIGPLDVRYTDPFGLAAGRASLGSSQSLYVIPVVVPLGDGGPVDVSGEGSARLVQRTATGSDDDLMTREYRTGDALRRVHWRASARHGELMVRQEEQRSFPEARLLLDTRRDGYAESAEDIEVGEAGHRRFEWTITMIASIGVHLNRSGFLVQVLETGPRQVAPLGDANQGTGQDVEFLLSLAGVGLTEPRSFVGERGDEHSANVLGPLFAVVANPAADTLKWILSQRKPYEAGVAFVLETGSHFAWDALAEAGWTCVSVTDADDPASVWFGIGNQVLLAKPSGR